LFEKMVETCLRWFVHVERTENTGGLCTNESRSDGEYSDY